MEVLSQAQAWPSRPRQYFSQTLCTYYLSFFVQIMCSGTTWLMPLGGNFCHVVAACPKCRQNAGVLGASLKGLLSNLEL